MQDSNYANDVPLAVAIAAHRGTSFTPERRGAQVIADYVATLTSDFESLKALANTDEKLVQLAEEFARYRAGYRQRKLHQLRTESTIMSTMIAGPANFPVRRMEKINGVARRRLEDLIEFRKRALAAIARTLTPELQPIRSGDSDAIERLKAEIAALEQRQERMKATNALIRKHAKAGADAQVAALVELGHTEELARELLRPDACGRIGYPDYKLTNNNANIRRMKARVTVVAAAQSKPVTEREGANGIRFEDDPPANRVRLFFPGKPDAVVRAALKARGFRWAPTIGAWQAYRNSNSLEHAKAVAGVKTTDCRDCDEGQHCGSGACCRIADEQEEEQREVGSDLEAASL